MKVLFQARGLRVSRLDGRVPRATGAPRRPPWPQISQNASAYPLFVKPANLGSSVGISKVHGPGELAAALELAAGFDRKIVVEAAVPDAREIEVRACSATTTPEASVPGEIVPSREFYDYEAKYLDAGSRTEIPARLDDAMAQDVRRQAIAAFHAIDGAGLARVDFLLSRTTGELFINEINTMPGLHDDQHVLEAVGRERRRLSDARRSTDRARPRASRREAGVEDERVLTRRARRGAREFLTHAPLCA